jgi:hypothetical protein
MIGAFIPLDRTGSCEHNLLFVTFAGCAAALRSQPSPRRLEPSHEKIDHPFTVPTASSSQVDETETLGLPHLLPINNNQPSLVSMSVTTDRRTSEHGPLEHVRVLAKTLMMDLDHVVDLGCAQSHLFFSRRGCGLRISSCQRVT